MQDNTYNGWTNWETWNFKLWIDNNQETYDSIRWMAKYKSINEIRKELKLFCYDIRSDIYENSGFFADVMNKSINLINFQEIAEHIFEEIKEEK